MLPMNEYQKQAAESRVYGNHIEVIYPILGLSGEAGELANKYKKLLRDKGLPVNAGRDEIAPEDKKDLILELGDCLWYVSRLAEELGYSLEEVAQMNLEKLRARKNANTLRGSGDDR